ncbi:retrotransposon-related protein, partial [Tanacetum coccineum]
AQLFIESHSSKTDVVTDLNHPFPVSLSGLSDDEGKDIELLVTLLASAEKTGQRQFDCASKLIDFCNTLLSNEGNPVERLGRQLGRGMRTKAAPGWLSAAAEWFRWMSRNGLITTWDRFVKSVKNHFGLSKYEDPQGALSKLLQLVTSTSAKTLAAVGSQKQSLPHSGGPSTSVQTAKSPLLPNPNANSKPLAIKWISPTECQEGLCFNCDNRWGVTVEVDLYVLPMQGPDVVLGIQWLQNLGKVTHDYAKQTMEFTLLNTTYSLKGDDSLRMKRISLHQMQALLEQDGVPTSLPPTRSIDHRIHLLPDTKPVNVRPYRYPHYQKGEMEKLVSEMLSQVTIKDKFPIPTVNEMFDELGGASIFTKIMSITKEQQQALDDALVLREQRLRIGNYNYRLSTTFKPKEPTFHVALDVLSLSPFYQAFLISGSLPAIYMHELWATVSYHKHCIKLNMNKKNYSFDLETFRDMLQICLNLPGQKFEDPPFE